ncbi:hypothetical protein SASPL_134016 [Salvia splendens]|uniref:Myb/SANT-like domain-containing protein n=1 Tax=Salvia splendens TaxID=180675 RepID=A0A8X8X3S4_SALSN|nr:hypothetical protein SASPL_134016 [Salvia splendens]
MQSGLFRSTSGMSNGKRSMMQSSNDTFSQEGGMSNGKRPMMQSCTGTFSQDGVAVSGRQKFRKGDRSRRIWIFREEEILAATLLDLVAHGWKSDNGFRTGYLTKIEESLRAEFPNCDLRGTPHITSKIGAWKKSYGILRSILSRTGIGFNLHNDFKIDIDDEQWEQIVQANKDAKFMRNKPWPFWEQWKCIFGKDRAGGGGAEQVDAAAEHMRSHLGGGSQCNENDYHPSFDDLPFADGSVPATASPELNESSSRYTEKEMSTTKGNTLKRKSSSPDTQLFAFLANLHAETNSCLDVIASRIGYGFDMGKARQEVFDKLGTVDGLSLDQRYDLCNILGDKPQRLEVFIGMPASARLGYVMKLIEESRRCG